MYIIISPNDLGIQFNAAQMTDLKEVRYGMDKVRVELDYRDASASKEIKRKKSALQMICYNLIVDMC